MSYSISYIHNNKLGKYNYQYIDKDGSIYIGLKDGRLKKIGVTSSTTGSQVDTRTLPTVSSASTSTTTTISTTTQDTISPFLLMGG